MQKKKKNRNKLAENKLENKILKNKCEYERTLTYAKIFLMNGLIGSPIDILELGPFRSGTEGSRIRSALVRIPDDKELSLITIRPSFYFTSALQDALFTTYPVRAKFVR